MALTQNNYILKIMCSTIHKNIYRIENSKKKTNKKTRSINRLLHILYCQGIWLYGYARDKSIYFFSDYLLKSFLDPCNIFQVAKGQFWYLIKFTCKILIKAHNNTKVSCFTLSHCFVDLHVICTHASNKV